MDYSIIEGHWFPPFEQSNSSRFETFVCRINALIFSKSLFNYPLNYTKRNIYISRRQLVIGDLGHVKDLDVISNSKMSNRTFGTANYLAPEAYELRRSNKIDIWSFGCIVYELFHLDKLFNNRSPDKLRISILSFQVETLNSSKISPLYVRVIKRYLLLFII